MAIGWHSREDNNTGVWQCADGCGYTLCDECFKVMSLHATTITIASTVDCIGTRLNDTQLVENRPPGIDPSA